MMAEPTALQRNAVHEAAHAVLARLLGGRALGVDVLDTPEQRGLARVDVAGMDAANVATVVAAGDTAERMLAAGWRGPDVRAGAWYMEQALTPAPPPRPTPPARLDSAYTARVAPTAGERMAARTAASRLLAANWTAVLRVADALLERGRLDAANVLDMVPGAAVGPPNASGMAHLLGRAPLPGTDTRMTTTVPGTK